MSENDFTMIGQIVRPQGVKGEVRILPMTMDIGRFSSLKKVYIFHKKDDASADIRTVERCSYRRNGMVVLKLSGCYSVEDAERLRGCDLKIPDSERIHLEADAYFWSDLLCMDVISDKGEKLGKIKEIFPTGSNDVIVVSGEKHGEILLPFISDVIIDVDVDRKVMRVHVLDGLI